MTEESIENLQLAVEELSERVEELERITKNKKEAVEVPRRPKGRRSSLRNAV